MTTHIYDTMTAAPPPGPLPEFFTVHELAKALRLDRHTVTRLFSHEPGVVIVGNCETRRGQRKYRMLRVPASVVNRVISRLTVRG